MKYVFLIFSLVIHLKLVCVILSINDIIIIKGKSKINKIDSNNYSNVKIELENIDFFFIYFYDNKSICTECIENFRVLEVLHEREKIEIFRVSDKMLINDFFNEVSQLPSFILYKNEQRFLYSNTFDIETLSKYVYSHKNMYEKFIMKEGILNLINRTKKSILVYIGVINYEFVKDILVSSFESGFNDFIIDFSNELSNFLKLPLEHLSKNFYLCSFSKVDKTNIRKYELVNLTLDDLKNNSQDTIDHILLSYSIGNFPDLEENEISNLMNFTNNLVVLYYSDKFDEKLFTTLIEKHRKHILFVKSKVQKTTNSLTKDIKKENPLLEYLRIDSSDLPAIVYFINNQSIIDHSSNNYSKVEKIHSIKFIRKNIKFNDSDEEFINRIINRDDGLKPNLISGKIYNSYEDSNNYVKRKIDEIKLVNLESLIIFMDDNNEKFKLILLCSNIHIRCHKIEEILIKIQKIFLKSTLNIDFVYIDTIFNDIYFFDYNKQIPSIVLIENLKDEKNFEYKKTNIDISWNEEENVYIFKPTTRKYWVYSNNFKIDKLLKWIILKCDFSLNIDDYLNSEDENDGVMINSINELEKDPEIQIDIDTIKDGNIDYEYDYLIDKIKDKSLEDEYKLDL